MCRCCCRCRLYGRDSIEERIILQLGGDTPLLRKEITKNPIISAMFRMLCDAERYKEYHSYCC